jgi:hypothetical protein
MANTTALNLADAVVDSLKTLTYGGSQLSAVRSLFPFYELKDLSNLKITVVPREVEISNFDREASAFDYEIDVSVQKAVESPDAEEVGTLMDLAETIAKSFRRKVYANLNNAACFKQSITLYSSEHIQAPSVFTSIVKLSFKIIK